MAEYSDLLYEVRGGIATITLNRPERLNAITLAMLASLSAALREADLDREVRVVVLTGAGRGFCAGLDLKDTAAGTGIGGDGANLALARFDLAGSPPV
ncbi:MAG TPA: enoyl-CoA hydratase-related protein, partial [Dehalococcoidia bacterium]|nr:enoyl-CoA hydratase-related protein [Dehalococcoidia bacterium]